jgi:hypothetical protein
MKPATKTKLALGGAAIVVCVTTYAILTTSGDTSGDTGMTIGGGGLGGFGDLFKKLLGSQGPGLGGLAPLPPFNPDLPLPPTGPDLGDVYGAGSTAPAPTGTTSDYVQQFKQSLIDFLTPPQVQGPTAAAAYSTAEAGQGGFNYTPDSTVTAGGYSALPDAGTSTPAGLNTFTVDVNPSSMTYLAPTGQVAYSGPTGYVDVSGEQVYQAQYGSNPSDTLLRDPISGGGAGNALAYVPDTGAPVYQLTPNGYEQVAAGTQLPAPSQDITQFQGYGLQDISGTPLTGAGLDPNAQTAPVGSLAIVPLANSNSEQNWWGFQGHNPNDPNDTN